MILFCFDVVFLFPKLNNRISSVSEKIAAYLTTDFEKMLVQGIEEKANVCFR